MRDDSPPAALPLLAFIVGLLLARHGLSVSLPAVSLVALLLWPRRRRGAIAVALLALGIARSGSPPPLPSLQPNRFVTIQAPIEGDWRTGRQSASLRASQFTAGGRTWHQTLTLYVPFAPPPIRRQKFIRAEGFLRPLTGYRYALSVKSPRLLSYGGQISILAPSSWNRMAQQRLEPFASAHPDEMAMIEALLLGRGERLSEDTRRNFRRGGTYHLLVFSGLQIALAAGMIALLLRWAGARRASDWLLLCFALLAPAFIGPTASVSRASAGIALYAVSRLLQRPTSFENLWCLAALSRLVLVPGDLCDPAFQLTYAGAGALIFIGRPMAGRARWAAYALAAEIVLTPLTLFHFHQFALGGSLLTIVLTPVIFVMLVTGGLFCLTGAMILLPVLTGLNTLCVRLNDLGSPFSGFFASPPAMALATGLLGAIASIVLFRQRQRAVLVAVAMLIPTTGALARHLLNRNANPPRATFLDVGQGDSILLRSGVHNVLVDGGGRADDPRFGESVLLPLLVDRGVRRIDIIVLSHAHPDHCGGLPAVIEQLDVGELWLSPRRFRGRCAQTLLEAVGDRATTIRLIGDERQTSAGELRLCAFAAGRAIRRAAENNSSVVVRVESRGRSLLLTGDIEREAEANLAPRIDRVDLLKVPHHGSRSSSTPILLQASRPRVAVVSCGAHNWFGHPHADVIEALRSRRIRVLRTDRSGTIDCILDRRIVIRTEFDTPR